MRHSAPPAWGFGTEARSKCPHPLEQTLSHCIANPWTYDMGMRFSQWSSLYSESFRSLERSFYWFLYLRRERTQERQGFGRRRPRQLRPDSRRQEERTKIWVNNHQPTLNSLTTFCFYLEWVPRLKAKTKNWTFQLREVIIYQRR